MIKSEIIANLSLKLTNLSEAQVANSINEIVKIMSEALVQKKRIEIRGFGSFTLRHRKSRMAHNPKTGEKVITAPKYRVHFKPGKELKELVQKSVENVNITAAE